MIFYVENECDADFGFDIEELALQVSGAVLAEIGRAHV